MAAVTVECTLTHDFRSRHDVEKSDIRLQCDFDLGLHFCFRDFPPFSGDADVEVYLFVGRPNIRRPSTSQLGLCDFC